MATDASLLDMGIDEYFQEGLRKLCSSSWFFWIFLYAVVAEAFMQEVTKYG